MRPTLGWTGVPVLVVALELAGCRGDDGKRTSRSGDEASESGAAGRGKVAARAPRARPRVPPRTIEVESSIAGKKLRPWTRSQKFGDQRVGAGSLPGPVKAELVALVEPVARQRPSIRWVRVMKPDGGSGPATVALSYRYEISDEYGSGAVFGFTAARDRGGKYKVHQAVEITTREGGDWKPAKDRDVDGDGVAETAVLYNQRQDLADAKSPAEGGLVILGSKTASALPVQLFERSQVEGFSEYRRPWANCWTEIDNHQVLLVITKQELMVEEGGQEQPMKTKFTADVYSTDKAGNLKPVVLHAGVVGGATEYAPLTEEWAEWIGDVEAEPAIEESPRSEAWDPVDCPRAKRLAFIVPKRVTKPKGNVGFYLLAWPSLERARAAKGVAEARLPETAVVEIGGEE